MNIQLIGTGCDVANSMIVVKKIKQWDAKYEIFQRKCVYKLFYTVFDPTNCTVINK